VVRLRCAFSELTLVLMVIGMRKRLQLVKTPGLAAGVLR